MSSFPSDNCISTTAQWSDLPGDLLAEIGKRLPSRLDVQRFRGVCSSWRRSIQPRKPKYSSMRLPYPGISSYENPKRYHSIKEIITYCIEPPTNADYMSMEDTAKCWFVLMQEDKNGKMHVIHPKLLVSLETLPDSFPRTLNLLEYRVREVSSIYLLDFADDSDEKADEFERINFFMMDKIAICDEGNDRFSVMLIDRDEELCVLRKGDKEWHTFEGVKDDTICHADFVCHNGKFYIIDCDSSSVFVIDPFRLTIGEFANGINWPNTPYLISSCGELFVVAIRVDYGMLSHTYCSYKCYFDYDGIRCSFGMEVFKLDEKKNRWVSIDNLKELAFFTSIDGSFVL